MSTPDQPTCGKGLAENSILPAQLSELVAAMVENLEAHMKALDVSDENSRLEYVAYERLASEYHQIAVQLQSVANQMAGYRLLPMGRHYEEGMTHPRVRDAFEKLVKRKRELLSLLEQTAERDDKLLETMRLHNR
jgi:hypothetical protein